MTDKKATLTQISRLAEALPLLEEAHRACDDATKHFGIIAKIEAALPTKGQTP